MFLSCNVHSAMITEEVKPAVHRVFFRGWRGGMKGNVRVAGV